MKLDKLKALGLNNFFHSLAMVSRLFAALVVVAVVYASEDVMSLDDDVSDLPSPWLHHPVG